MPVRVSQCRRLKIIKFQTASQADEVKAVWDNIKYTLGYNGQRNKHDGELNYKIMMEMLKDYYIKIKGTK
jgi:hypothetical protein